jgi:predicted transcriptional regulator
MVCYGCSIMAKREPLPERLSRREREIMQAIFALDNRASAEQIRARLAEPPSYSAVRAMLVRLEAKGHVRHVEEANRYVYSATTSPAAARRTALQQYLGVFFGGRRRDLLLALLRDEKWTNDELDTLAEEIKRARKK